MYFRNVYSHVARSVSLLAFSPVNFTVSSRQRGLHGQAVGQSGVVNRGEVRNGGKEGDEKRGTGKGNEKGNEKRGEKGAS